MSQPSRRRLLAAGAGAASAAALPAASGPARAQVKSLGLAKPTLEERVTQAGVPALGYAVVGADGVHALETAGRRRIDRFDSVTDDDPWHIGADTQAMTAALYARLVEQGRAAWRARLPALFPDLKLDPAWGEVRIEDLLAHRAGLSDRRLLTPARLRAFRQDARPVAVQRTTFAAEVLGRPPDGRPEAFDYSDAGYLLAGAAIERIVKAEWEAAITLNLFQPLGMDNAAFGAPTGEAPWGHELGPDRKLVAVDPASLADLPPILGPAGRVHLPLADYAKFARVFLADGAGWIGPDSLARLARPWNGERSGDAMGWRTSADSLWARGPLLGQEGSNGFWRADGQVAPGRGLAILTVCNTEAGGGAEAARELGLALVKLYAPVSGVAV